MQESSLCLFRVCHSTVLCRVTVQRLRVIWYIITYCFIFNQKLKKHQILGQRSRETTSFFSVFLTKSEETLQKTKNVLDAEKGPPKNKMDDVGSPRVLRDPLQAL